MDLVILDLEWNGSYSRKKKGYLNEIIEFGAIRCDADLAELDSFTCLVRPQVAKHLSSATTTLTHITDAIVSKGTSYMQAVRQFRKWAKDAVILTWSTSDVLSLIDNCQYFSGDPIVPFLTHYCNLQAYVQQKLGNPSAGQLGLIAAAEQLSIETENCQHHRALADSRLSLEVLRKLYDPALLQTFIQDCDDEFYGRLTFKPVNIGDLNHPLIRPEHLRFPCPSCLGKTEQLEEFQYRNHGFRGLFQCDSCGEQFHGRVFFKTTYEGLSVKKKTLPLPIIESPAAPIPGTVGNMQLDIHENGVGILRFPAFAPYEAPDSETGLRLVHGFSTRIGGVSRNEFAAMNLGFHRGDSEMLVSENYYRFAEAFDVPIQNFVAGDQKHHTNIRHVDIWHKGSGIWKPSDVQDIDGLCTDMPGLPLIVYCADCVPLYFYDPVNQAIGLAHAGWKGTAAGMGSAMVEKMAEDFGTDPSRLLVGIGPSISPGAFEVDQPVANVFLALPGADAFVFEAPGDPQRNKHHVDLWACNRENLRQAGVPPENISLGGVCTMEHSDLLFSHRKTRGARGSNAALLCLMDD